MLHGYIDTPATCAAYCLAAVALADRQLSRIFTIAWMAQLCKAFAAPRMVVGTAKDLWALLAFHLQRHDGRMWVKEIKKKDDDNFCFITTRLCA